MAGLGYRAFTGGSVITAAQVQGYLQDQAVMKFASATARDAAITSPTEGMVCYLADSSAMFAYDGGSWCIVPVTSEFVTNTTYTIASPAATAQNVYAATGSGASLAAGFTYRVEGLLRANFTVGLTGNQGSMQLTYSGTAASSYIQFNGASNTSGYNLAIATANTSGSVGVNTAQIVTHSQSGATVYNTVWFNGIVRTTTAGTLTPQYLFSNNTTLTNLISQPNSYFRVTPIGSSTMTSAGTWV
jgi:hypothetical protein